MNLNRINQKKQLSFIYTWEIIQHWKKETKNVTTCKTCSKQRYLTKIKVTLDCHHCRNCQSKHHTNYKIVFFLVWECSQIFPLLSNSKLLLYTILAYRSFYKAALISESGRKCVDEWKTAKFDTPSPKWVTKHYFGNWKHSSSKVRTKLV